MSNDYFGSTIDSRCRLCKMLIKEVIATVFDFESRRGNGPVSDTEGHYFLFCSFNMLRSLCKWEISALINFRFAKNAQSRIQ